MRHFRLLLSSTAFVALATGALAVPATQEGADRLTAVMQSYLTATPGVVTVTPAGDIYRMTVDLGPLAALVPADTATLTVSPLSYELIDNGDATWMVKGNQPLTVSFSMPGAIETTFAMTSIVEDGVWSEGLQSFTSYTADITNMTTNQTVTDPVNGAQTTTSTYATMQMTTSGTAGANGGVDSVIDGTSTGYTSTIAAPMGPGMPPMNLTISAAGQDFHYETKGVRSGAMLDLVAFFVANASATAPTPELQEALRGKLGGAMPFFESVSGTANVNAFKVATPMGEFGTARLATDFAMNGAVADGRIRMALAMEGLTIPAGIAPPWAEPLVPTEARFDVEVSKFNLADPANAMIAAFDLMKPEPFEPGFEGGLIGMFMPTGAVDIAFLPTSVSNDTYSVNLEGGMSAGPMGMPTGQGKITATGLDKVQEILSAAPPEVSGQVLMPLGMATGLAKPGANGELVWEIDATTPGSVKINGMDMMGMQ